MMAAALRCRKGKLIEIETQSRQSEDWYIVRW
jgi:hypothetical protein